MHPKANHSEQKRQGYLYAVRLLSQSKRSEHELSERLQRKGYPSDITERILRELKSNGILSDQKMVQDTVEWSIRGKRYGRRRIEFELKRRGIAEFDIQKSLESYSKEEEQELARTLARERWTKLERVETHKRKKRLYDFLVSRGFDFELARQVAAEMERCDHGNF